jgi:hypothetical protein
MFPQAPQGEPHEGCASLEVANPQATGLYEMPLCRMKCKSPLVGRTMFYRCRRHEFAYGFPIFFGTWQWLEPMFITLIAGQSIGDPHAYDISSYPFDPSDSGFRTPAGFG